MSATQRRSWISRADPDVSVTTQATLLGISRASLYYKAVAPSEREVGIKHRIDELYTACPFYGSRKLQALLAPEFGSIARNTVRHYMHEMGIHARYPVPNLSRRRREEQVYPYLLRGVSATQPNHIWGIDITYIRLACGWMYLVAVLDWYAR